MGKGPWSSTTLVSVAAAGVQGQKRTAVSGAYENRWMGKICSVTSTLLCVRNNRPGARAKGRVVVQPGGCGSAARAALI